jgi:hypothetical protein
MQKTNVSLVQKEFIILELLKLSVRNIVKKQLKYRGKNGKESN